LESENTYREQLQAWLDLLKKSGSARQLFVLCDEPNSAQLPQDAGPQKPGSQRPILLKADRTNFLALIPKLAGLNSPTSVIAWGHGGKQGSTPVFHVRGPRITPADFKTVATQIGAVESKWILLFRGSGFFASQLAAEQRQILSSEGDTMFASDPVGMALLLKLARAKPEISFSALGEEFGRATVAWYKERNLARTEEPTLWLAKEKPRLLSP